MVSKTFEEIKVGWCSSPRDQLAGFGSTRRNHGKRIGQCHGLGVSDCLDMGVCMRSHPVVVLCVLNFEYLGGGAELYTT